jgi:predicted metal-dependent hydrolase
LNNVEIGTNNFPPSNGGKGIDYRIRMSPRAKNVRLKLSLREGLTVVVPAHFDLRRVPAIVEQKREWIETHLRQFGSISAAAAGMRIVALPERIELPALGESWIVEYRPAKTSAVGVIVDEPGRITVYGAVHHRDTCRTALIRWLQLRAREELVPLLSRLAEEKGFRFTEVFIRGQKTRWASCSSRGMINLSYKLLFLDPDAVRCVLLHELCHTVHMNHSACFWDLLRSFEADCRIIHKRLRAGWKLIPAWVEERPEQDGGDGLPVDGGGGDAAQ